MDRISGIIIGVFVLGLVILVIPDDASPVFTFNKTHGPSLPDLAGLFLMLGSWFLCLIMIARQWKPIEKRLGKGNAYLGMGLYLLFIAGIATALLFSFEWMLWVCIAFASTINIGFIIFAWQAKDTKAD